MHTPSIRARARALVFAVLAAGVTLPAAASFQVVAAQAAFTPDQLDNLVAPIALYPDPLLAQVLLASTFPDQITAAVPVVGSGNVAVVDNEGWDVSVRAVAHYPRVLDYMANQIDWTTKMHIRRAGHATFDRGRFISELDSGNECGVGRALLFPKRLQRVDARCPEGRNDARDARRNQQRRRDPNENEGITR
jgi:hypothetical protein